MDVHARLARHLLVDGYRLVLDLELSRGSWLVDARNGRRYLDFYTFFASAPLGVNPPFDPDFAQLLGQVARNKPANPDIYTEHLADFVDTFARVLGDPELPHLFFVEGGALAVENALKTAFDWKSRRNEAAGRSRDLGTKVLHLTKAFHGRSGYTLSLTNTEPGKTDRFPKFDWPRIDVPAIHFGDVEAAEERALAQAREAFERNPYDIACFIAEPIQGEGGDNHMRPEFLQAMQRMCHEYDALFILDEVQTGGGMTGTPWAYQQLGLAPDVVAFAKKVQVGGIMAGRRVDLVPDNVFQQSGRINSTWGGGLVDMVRSRGILEIIERDGLIARAGTLGSTLLDDLTKLEAESPELVSNVRGRGLMCAFDLPDQAARDALVTRLREDHGVLALPCGPRSIRLRPALNIPEADVDHGLQALSEALTA
ncbi:L-lysine 6-transaminase [Nonomuraea sp. NPDC049784]|uniref:L-lysine 6-transaminase n=1 Tax=Nonomuraea sp. NPDC049784 TaxID=3154361 RepID=UPI0033D5CCB7